MHPLIALNGEGLPAWALKGHRQEGYRPSGKRYVCEGGEMKRLWGSHLIPNSWVGLRPTLFPSSEYCHGPGSRALTPKVDSKKPWEDCYSQCSRRNELPITRVSKTRFHRIPSLSNPPSFRLSCLSKMPRRSLGDL